MTTTALSCGNVDRTVRSEHDGVQWVDVPAVPGKAELDPLLAEPPDRLVVHGTDADLAAVVLRLLRRGLVSHVVVGYVPVAASSASAVWGLTPGDVHRAVGGSPRPSALVRDDAGGVLLGSGRIEPFAGQLYCDDQLVVGGSARSVEIAPDPDAAPLPEPTADPLSASLTPAEDGVRVVVTRRGWFRPRRAWARGRAVQAGFGEATVTRDGVAHPRPARKWGWYRHTEDLWLVR